MAIITNYPQNTRSIQLTKLIQEALIKQNREDIDLESEGVILIRYFNKGLVERVVETGTDRDNTSKIFWSGHKKVLEKQKLKTGDVRTLEKNKVPFHGVKIISHFGNSEFL